MPNPQSNILVTGGAGYIGSHTVHVLRERGYNIVVLDNLSTGHAPAVPRDVPLIIGDIRDTELVQKTLQEHSIQAVIHFAADSLVGESMEKPAKYYRNNVVATLSLLESMLACHVNKIVFSSTAAVYGEPEQYPITEDMPTKPTNVYGRTKLVIEGMLADFAQAYGLSSVSLRYFNAAGALPNGTIGEDHSPESHLIPLVLKTALGQRQSIDIYGSDYPTPDGTCVRDYIHVVDLAAAHVLAVAHLLEGGGSKIYNLGSEQGFSVREVLTRAKILTAVDFPVREAGRRSGDPAILVAASTRIRNELGWQPRYSDLDTIIGDAWHWHKNNPQGF